MKFRPIPPTLRGYQASWLGPDVLAGLTLVAIAVPEQMATARLASMPAIAGLYAFICGSVLFAAFGKHSQMSVGADSTIAPIIATGVAAVAVLGAPHYIALVSFLALMVGAFVLVIGLARMGWISELLSTPVITGVLAGIAVEILVRQLPAIFGLSGGGSTTIGRVRAIADEFGKIHGWPIAIAVGVFVVIEVSERINRRIPGALIGLVLSIGAVALFGLQSHGVAVVGSIHGGLPSFSLPRPALASVRALIVPALTIAFVCIAQTAATVRASGAAVSAAQDFNRDLVALGAGSLAAGLSGSFPVNSSPPRTAIVTASGGKSQLSSLLAAAVVLVVALLATGLLKDLPKATLGAILVFVATRMFRVGILRTILEFSRIEFGLAVLTLVTVAVVGIEPGVALAVVVSLGDRTRRAARPRDAVLGREPGTDHWIPPDVGRHTEQVPGVVAYLLYGPLWYGNADYVRLRVREAIESAAQPVHGLVLDANGMSDIDFTAAETLGALATELKGEGIALGVARSSHLVHHDLKHSGLLKAIGPEHLFASVEDAVDALVGPPAASPPPSGAAGGTP